MQAGASANRVERGGSPDAGGTSRTASPTALGVPRLGPTLSLFGAGSGRHPPFVHARAWPTAVRHAFLLGRMSAALYGSY